MLRTRNLEGRDLPVSRTLLRRVADTGQPELFTAALDGGMYRAIVYPLGLLGPRHRQHLLQVAASTAPTEATLLRVLQLMTLLVLGGAAAAGLLGWWLAGAAVRPLRSIVRQAGELDVRRPDHVITAHSDTEEIGQLIAVLNSLLDRAHDALEAQRLFLAEAGHEIRTPLTVLRGDIDVALRRRRSGDEYESVLRQTLEDLRRTSGLADDLITLSRSHAGTLEPRVEDVAVDGVAEACAASFCRAAEAAGATIDVDVEPGLNVSGDATLLRRALGNLLDNAIKYGGRRIHVEGGAAADGRVRVAVIDDGSGVNANEIERLGRPFYRGRAGRAAAAGSGLGLAIVRGIANSLGGELRIRSAAACGITAELLLPAGRAQHDFER